MFRAPSDSVTQKMFNFSLTIEPVAAAGFCARFGTWDDNRFVQSGNWVATTGVVTIVSRPGPEQGKKCLTDEESGGWCNILPQLGRAFPHR